MNKFGLVYEGAIEENIEGEVNIINVDYEVSGIKVSGNLYLPANFDETKKYSAISVAHPMEAAKNRLQDSTLKNWRNWDMSHWPVMQDIRAQVKETPETGIGLKTE